MKKSILKNIMQLFLIVFSVVLGLFLSERIEEIKNNKEAEKLLSRIKAEVKVNKIIVEEWTPYHREIAIKLDTLCNNDKFIEDFIKDESVLFDKLLTKGTFMSTMPTKDTWDIAKSHPLIVNFDYDQLLILSKVYNQQLVTFEPALQISDIFLSPDFNSKKNAKVNLQILKNRIREIVGRELQLLDYYNTADKILNLQNN
jgi:hypothetical protein